MPSDDLLNTPVWGIGLKFRTHSVLRARGIETLGDLLSKSGGELLRLSGFGYKSFLDVRDCLDKMGLKLGDPLAVSLSLVKFAPNFLELVEKIAEVSIKTDDNGERECMGFDDDWVLCSKFEDVQRKALRLLAEYRSDRRRSGAENGATAIEGDRADVRQLGASGKKESRPTFK